MKAVTSVEKTLTCWKYPLTANEGYAGTGVSGWIVFYLVFKCFLFKNLEQSLDLGCLSSYVMRKTSAEHIGRILEFTLKLKFVAFERM